MRRIARTLAVAAYLLLAPAAAHAARAWTTAPVSQTGEDGVSGGLAVSAAGESLAAYNASDGSGAGPLLKVAAFPAGGGSPTTTTLQPSWTYDPVIASGGGNTTVAWESETTGDTIRVATRPDGGAFAAAQDLGAGQGGLVLRMNPRGDAALLFVRYTNQWTDQQLFLALRPAGSSSFGTPIAVSDVVRSDYHYYRDDLALTPDGRVVVAWEELTSTGSVVKVAQRSITGVAALPVQTLSAAGGTAARPWVATDAVGDAIVSWLDVSGSDAYVGAVRAAVASPGAPFGAAQSIAGYADRYAGARVVSDANGNALIAWADVDAQGTLGVLKGATVKLPSGAISSPGALTADQVDDYGVTPAVDSAGNAIVFYNDFHTDELRAVRRASGGTTFSAPETLICPRPIANPLAAAFAPGSAEVLWRQLNANLPHQGIRLTTDHDAPQSSPGPCPPPPPTYTVSPASPQPGDDITIDARGAVDPEAAYTYWAWDLDNDGTFEIPDGTDDTVEHVRFANAGTYHVRLRVTQGNGRGNSGYGIWPIEIDVGSGTSTASPPPQTVTSSGYTASGSSGPQGDSGGQPGYPTAFTLPSGVTYSDDPPTALRYLLTGWRPSRVEPVLASGGASGIFVARERGKVAVRWLLDGLDHRVLATGSADVSRGVNDINVTLTPQGRDNLRHAIQWVPIRMQAAYTTATGTVSQELSYNLSRDLCHEVPLGIHCHQLMWGHTRGGRSVGKVSHSGWPDISGVLWIADHSGVRGTATKFSDELLGGHGSDWLSGGPGDDVIWGDEWPTGNTTRQHDVLIAGAGDDWVYASHGVNDIVAGPGNDTIWSVYAVRADIYAGSGDDRIVARRGRGTIDCGAGHDTIWVPRHGYQLFHCEDVRHTHPSPFARLP